MSNIRYPTIPPAKDLTELQQYVIRAFQHITDQLNADKFTSTINANNNRIANVDNPAANRDAVNKKYVDDGLARVQAALNATGEAGTSTGTATATIASIQIAYA